MAVQKHIELIVNDESPKALIIGRNKAADALSERLASQGCLVQHDAIFSPSSGVYDYIFHFGNPSAIEQVLTYHLQPTGKYLYIDAGSEHVLSPTKGIKILRIGDIEAWNIDELIDVILHSLYSRGSPAIIDESKIAAKTIIPHTVYHPVTTDKKKNLTHYKIKSPIHISSLTIQRVHFFTGKKLAVLVLCLFLLTATASGLFYWYVFSVRDTITRFRLHVASSNWEEVEQDIQQVKKQLTIAKKTMNIANTIAFPLRNISMMKDTSALITVSEQLLMTVDDLLLLGRDFQKRSFGSLTSANTITHGDIVQLSQNLNRTARAVSSSKKELEKIKFSFFPKESFITVLDSTELKLKDTYDLLPLAEKLILVEQPKVYMVLMQNNMELRPTGGFIGSYGLLTIQRGRIIDFQIEDVYTADGQLKGHVDPPSPIRKFLSQPHFFLRDSNFDPDFAASAVRAAWFLQKEMGNTVDGVIGVNLFFVQKLLRVLGPVRILEFNNEQITADNFFLKAQFYSQNNFFPGSTQKKDFLQAVTNNLFTKLSFDNNSSWIQLLPVVRQSLDEKNITFFFFDEASQKLVEQKGWAGRIVEVKCNTNESVQQTFPAAASCYPDYIAVNEANLGVNKANFFVSKSVAVGKNIDTSGKITTTITLSYENANTPEVFGSTTYTSYVRILVPLGSVLSSVTLNLVPLSSADVDIEPYGLDKTSFGFLIRIAPENKGIVEITYILPYQMKTEDGSYQLLIQKQPGDKISALAMSFNNNASYHLKSVNFPSSIAATTEHVTDTSVDRIFAFDIVP